MRTLWVNPFELCWWVIFCPNSQSDKDQAMQKIVRITYMRKKWLGEGLGFRKPSPWAPLDKFPVIEHQLLYKVLRWCSHQHQLSRSQALLHFVAAKAAIFGQECGQHGQYKYPCNLSSSELIIGTHELAHESSNADFLMFMIICCSSWTSQLN